MNALTTLAIPMLFAITLMVHMSVSAMMDMLAMEQSVKVKSARAYNVVRV